VALHGSIDGSHGDAVLKVRRGNVRVGGEKSEHGDAEAAENEYENSDNYAENELAHEASKSNYCGRWLG
jgi:hypothetical protein